MKILVVLTYYRPHTSGLTIYTERLCKALVKRGHQVTVLTSQYDNALLQNEIVDGVRIVRAPVLFRLSKGVIMPTFGMLTNSLVAETEVIQLHLPQFDAAGVALRGRILRKPTVITYHCDLRMPPGLLSWLANQAVRVMNNLAGLFTHRIVTYTRDYAENSNYLSRYLPKLRVIPPPVVLPQVAPEAVRNFDIHNNPQNRKPVIGMAARFATEKGVEVLLDALPEILLQYPQAQVQFAGPYGNIIGEENYFSRLSPRIEKYITSGNWRFVGTLSPEKMAAYYPNLDVLVLPSLNSTEAFGLVQIEAMLNGVPCVASDLPGVRQPVKLHGMGKISAIGDAKNLADMVIDVLDHREKYQGDRTEIARRYDPDTIAAEYEKLFNEMQRELKH
ncbi:MAG TPA: glycosyltransferase family 4 protein [Longilinea sp.]|nr:glycosyltransferase family 4 protein [Longilinea sp.]